MITTIFKFLTQLAVYLFFSIGIFLMARIVAQYFSFDPHVGFLAVKQDYLPIAIWRVAFYVHVFSSLFTLMAGVIQFSQYIQSNYPSLHRWVGRLYVVDVLILNTPAGLIMAIYANGHLPSKIAFTILVTLWFWFTLRAYQEVRKRNFKAHERFMTRSYALTFSAVTLRFWRMVLSSLFTINPTTLYMIDAWLGFVPNLLIAEWIIRRRMTNRERIIDESRISSSKQL